MEIYFLSRQQTADFLGSDDDGFIQRLTRCDLRARKCQSNNEYRQMAVLSADEFTLDEKNKLITFCQKAEQHFVGMPALPWVFAKAHYEEGLPHTRTNIIFMDNVLSVLTLVHERVHVYQKQFPEICREACRGYIQVSRPDLELYRSNPDTDSKVWMRDGILCGKFYWSKSPTSILDCSQRAHHPLEAQAYGWTPEVLRTCSRTVLRGPCAYAS